MNLSKNIIFALFLLLLSIGMAEIMYIVSKNIFSDILFALVFNTGLSSCIFFIDSAVKFSLPNRYYLIKSFEINGTLYKMIGIKKAKAIFSHSPAIKFSGKKLDLSDLEGKMMFAERQHFLAFIILLIVTVYSIINSRWYFASALLVFDILLQGYPVMIQRYNRERLIKMQEKYNKSLQNGIAKGAS